jgi:hypothetical protein
VPLRKTLKKQNKNKKKHVFFCFPMFSFVFLIGRLAAKNGNAVNRKGRGLH